MPSLYKIYFKDQTIFNGGDSLENSKWDKIPSKSILCLEYFLNSNESLMLCNFEAYAAITEVLNPVIKKLGNCPKCNALGKVTQAVTKHGDGRISKKLMARCKNDKCNWIGNITDLKQCKNCKSGKWKYIMGLKEGTVTSYRISLDGIDGKDKYQLGDITRRQYPKGKEYRGKPIADFVWKKGIIKKEVK